MSAELTPEERERAENPDAAELLFRRLCGRRAMNERTAILHPDSAVRAEAAVRATAYGLAYADAVELLRGSEVQVLSDLSELRPRRLPALPKPALVAHGQLWRLVPENAVGSVTTMTRTRFDGECASSAPFCLAPVDRMLHDDRWEYLGDELAPAP